MMLKQRIMQVTGLIAFVAVGAYASDLDIPWYTVDGGGVMHSEGGTLELSGTIGQPDAGAMLGGSLDIAGGFWGIFIQDALGRLSLEVVGECQSDGIGPETNQLTVDLWLRNPLKEVTGYQGFLGYDIAVLDFRRDLSVYHDDVFPLHVLLIEKVETSPGELTLDGLVAFGEPGTERDTHLATLVFDVLPGVACEETDVFFRPDPLPFHSELSFEGDALRTFLSDSGLFFLDNTPPTLDACPADEVQVCVVAPPELIGATDECDGATPVITFESSAPGSCSDEVLITRTWESSDGCGNAASCEQVIRVQNTQGPEIGPLGDIEALADAGLCSTVVNYTTPNADDDCGNIATVLCSLASGSAFPTGQTEVTCIAQDACDRNDEQSFIVDVQPFSTVSATIELASVDAPSTVQRCIALTARNGTGCSATVDAELKFNGNPATATVELELPCGDWTELCAKDEQHTLFDTVPLSISGTSYAAASTLVLVGGDTDNDSDIDINDATELLSQFGGPEPVGGCPWEGSRGADFSLNGDVGTEDYTFIATNWLTFTTCTCLSFPSIDEDYTHSLNDVMDHQGTDPDWSSGEEAGAVALELASSAVETSISVDRVDPQVARKLDLNLDGVIDVEDIELFEVKHGLPDELSRAMREVGRPRMRTGR